MFGDSKKKDPKLFMREWLSKFRKEDHKLDRDILGLAKEEEKVKNLVKAAIKRDDRNSCVMLSKQLLTSQKTILKIRQAKMHIKSVESNLNNQLVAIRTSGEVEKSTEVMKSMSQLVKIADLSKTMKEMSKEMVKIGLIEKLSDEGLDGLKSEDLEKEAQLEVDKIMWNVTGGKLGKASLPTAEALPASVMARTSKMSITEGSRTRSLKQAQPLTG